MDDRARSLAVLIAFVWSFDWNWLRPAIRHYVRSHADRDIEFDDLKVRFRGSLDPTIEFHGLFIQNAPWASSKQPFIRAGYAEATISWRSIGSGLIVVPLVVLEDAQIDMERQANGIRNWRLGHPDDVGPPHALVLALDARRSTLHTIHAGIGLEGDAQISPLAQSRPFAGHPDLPLTKHLVFEGRYKDHAFAVDTAVSDVLSFGATPQRFSLQGTVRAGGVRLDAQGVTNDVNALGEVDLDATLSTTGDGPLWPLPEALARARPFAATGHVAKTGNDWRGDAVHVTLGRGSALAGDVRYTGSLKDSTVRRNLRATLHDVVLDLGDARALAAKSEKAGSSATAEGSVPAIPSAPLPLARLRTFDADIDLKDARFVAADGSPVQTLRGHAVLVNGLLRLSALDLGVAGGHVTGTAQFDGADAPAKLALDLRATALQLARLSPKLAQGGSVAGSVEAHVELRARGGSARALASSAAGRIDASLAAGASVSKRLDAKLSLDGGEWLRSLFDKSDRVPIACAEVSLTIDHGVGTARRFAFETEHTALAGVGTVDLAGESLDATLTPARKTHALLALDKAIHAQGPWHAVKISLQPPAGDAVPARCDAAPSEPHAIR